MSNNSNTAMNEVAPLTAPGSSSQKSNNKRDQIKDYRQLAIGSIICGISCIGILALINSVKAKERRNRDIEKAQDFSHRAKKYSLLAIFLWVGILMFIPMLMAVVTYLLRKAE